jgi:hypothetical protein
VATLRRTPWRILKGFAARLAAFREAGVAALNLLPIAATPADRLKLIETLRDLVD